MTRFADALHVFVSADSALRQHPFKLGEVGGRERPIGTQFLHGDVIALRNCRAFARKRSKSPADMNACSTTSTANPLAGSSLTCTTASTIPGDTSRYQFADSVHLTPYGYKLLAEFVTLKLLAASWQ